MQIQYIVIEPFGSCWANTGDNLKSTESLTPLPRQHHVDVAGSPRSWQSCDYKAQYGSDSSDDTETNQTGAKVADLTQVATRIDNPEDGLLGSGKGEKITGSLSEIPTAVKVSFLRYIKKSLKRHGQRTRKTLNKLRELREMECLNVTGLDITKRTEYAELNTVTGEPLFSSSRDPVNVTAHTTEPLETDQVTTLKPFRFSDYIGHMKTE